MMVSLDGYTEGKTPDYNWHNWNEEMDGYMMNFFSTVDLFVYGRRSYEEMIAYWPPLNDPFANIMNETPKLVFSRTIHKGTWNATFTDADPVARLQSEKSLPGKDIVFFAGADLASTLIQQNAIDEYRLIVNPVVLNGAKPLWKDGPDMMQLRLVDTKTFQCGNVLLVYRPA